MAWDDSKTDFDRAHPQTALEYGAMVTRIKNHKNEHITGGTDAIPVATTLKTGLSPILPNDENVFYNGKGGFTAPPGTGTVTEVTGSGAIAVANGTVAPVVSIVAASAIVPGSMSAADFAKLAAVEALADVTDATNVNTAGAVMETDFNAQTLLIATADNTPLPLTIAASSFVGRKASGDAGIMSAAEAKTVLAITESDVANLTTDLAAKIAKTANITSLNETGIADGEIAVFNLSAKDIRTSNVIIATTLGADDTTLPTSKAVKDVTDTLVTKALYDANTVLIATTNDTPVALPVGASTFVMRKSTGNIVAGTPTEARTELNVANGANAYVHPNHTGEVTSTADGAQVIAAAAVTLAKMANLATDKLIGRETGTTGVPEAITCTAAGRALLDDANAAAQRTTLGLGTMAVETSGNYVANDLYGAQSVIVAVAADTPASLTLGELTVLGRDTSGNVDALSMATLRTMLNIADGAGAGTVLSVTATAPITSTEGTDPVIAITAASAGAAGSMSAAHYTKLEAIEAGANLTVITRQFSLDADSAILVADTPASSEDALTTYGFPLSKLAFTNAGKGTEVVYFKRHLDMAYAGGEFTGYLEFSITAAVSDTVSHRLYGLLVDDGDPYDQDLPLLATFTKGTNAAAAGTKYTSAAVTFTPTGTGNTLLLRLDRNSAGGVDTYTGDLNYISIYGTYPVA